jgi:hypothetical protein
MRLPILILLSVVVAIGLLSNVPLTAQEPSARLSASAATTQDLDLGELKVDINVNDSPSRGWTSNPMWLAIVGLGLLAVVALIVAASRGGTTVLKG